MTLGRLFVILLLAAAVLAVWVGFPTATKGFKLRRATIVLAVRCLDHNNDCENEIKRYMSDAYTLHGVTLRRSDIERRGKPTDPEIYFEVRATLPFVFPFINRTVYRQFTIKGGAQRPKGF